MCAQMAQGHRKAQRHGAVANRYETQGSTDSTEDARGRTQNRREARTERVCRRLSDDWKRGKWGTDTGVGEGWGRQDSMDAMFEEFE